MTTPSSVTCRCVYSNAYSKTIGVPCRIDQVRHQSALRSIAYTERAEHRASREQRRCDTKTSVVSSSSRVASRRARHTHCWRRGNASLSALKASPVRTMKIQRSTCPNVTLKRAQKPRLRGARSALRLLVTVAMTATRHTRTTLQQASPGTGRRAQRVTSSISRSQ